MTDQAGRAVLQKRLFAVATIRAHTATFECGLAAEKCHVWTAPAVQEANLAFCEAFGCSHVSGL